MSASTSATKSATSRSTKAGLQFPVGRIHRMMKNGKYSERVGAVAPVYMAAVLEYISAEILELSGCSALEHKRQRIIPTDIQLAIRKDEELNKLLGAVMTPSEPLPSLPSLSAVLLPKLNPEPQQ